VRIFVRALRNFRGAAASYGPMPGYQHHLFVCQNERDETAARPSCANTGGKQLRDALKDAVKAAGLKRTVRVNSAGCLDQCEHGPVVVVYPEAVWYGFVLPRDAQEIVQEHLLHGRPVERLRLSSGCINTGDCPHRKA
jgi:(2Fe-2S) ferredoxin